MNKNYIISIKGMQSFDFKHNEVMHFIVKGFYKQKNGRTYIYYVEYDNHNKFIMKKRVFSVLIIESDKKVTLIKKGGINSRLILECGKRHHCLFDTEEGLLMLGIFTYNIESSLSEHGGTLKIRYSIDFNSSLESINEININIKECPNNVATAS